jgi:hypothetical protein
MNYEYTVTLRNAVLPVPRFYTGTLLEAEENHENASRNSW